MSESALFETEGTEKIESEEREKLSGKNTRLYRCSPSLHPASVDRYLGMVVDTTDFPKQQQSSFEEPLGKIQKDKPALSIVDKKQEGHVITLQKWQGVVKSVSDDIFVAHVTDLLRSVPEEEVELFCSDIQDDDKELLFVGAVFYWCIGYIFSSSGQLTRASFLRFQRLPLYSQDSVKIAAKKAKDIQEGIRWL